MQTIRPIILAGGSGTRLAPLSTPDCPKPFIPLPQVGSLLTSTLQRISMDGFLPPILIGHVRHRYALLNHARDAGVLPAAILLEASAKNTALAIAQAAAWLPENDMLAFLPADHMIAEPDAWGTALQALATCDGLGVMGQIADTFSPEFGYIIPGDAAENGCFTVQQFLEKPATQPESNPLQNMGVVVGRRDAFAQALQHYAPDIWAAAQHAAAHAVKEYEFIALAENAAPITAPSFDNAVLEKLPNLQVCPVACGWRDVGTLAAWLEETGVPLHAQLTAPRRVDRPWGYYTTLRHTAQEAQKHLVIYPNCRLSLQRHTQRTEHWHVLAGTANVMLDNTAHTLQAGESITIAQGAWHRLSNSSNALLEIHETQTGTPDEADIERAADDYGRC